MLKNQKYNHVAITLNIIIIIKRTTTEFPSVKLPHNFQDMKWIFIALCNLDDGWWCEVRGVGHCNDKRDEMSWFLQALNTTKRIPPNENNNKKREIKLNKQPNCLSCFRKLRRSSRVWYGLYMFCGFKLFGSTFFRCCYLKHIWNHFRLGVFLKSYIDVYNCNN